ncbi:hypothetical protein AOZ06_17195 [Kibdelosporangium phytohabitans]|uniref:Crp/Fnr family transcriptional regulator n=1 Tax=Kibdelosporangium phytohabitans TaxID=860235 RepID=A0A0N9HXX2_9PSEU|nr:Crp/Fnr family transcriptional regulator [Kibdelosporangium phytohabitans]ALG08418.1 hypothetical protein AOZ06_17195 [Kibdelosporangium phytohabitans]
MRGRALDEVLRLGTLVSYEAQQQVIRLTDNSRHAVLLLGGSVKVVANTAHGRSVLVGIRGPGDLLDEMTSADGRPRTAQVIACSAVHARIIPGAHLDQFLERNAEACLAVARTLGERLWLADRRWVDFVACPARTRVVRVLAEIVQEHGEVTDAGHCLGFPLTQPEIAALAGTALSTVEKTFHSLEAEGVIDRGYRHVLVTDLSRLRRFGEAS